MSRKEYLGDSVYALDHGFQIELTTENGIGPSNTIFLEDTVLTNLFRFIEFNRRVQIKVDKVLEPATDKASVEL